MSLGILTASLRDVNPIVQMGKLSLRGYVLKVTKLNKGRGWVQAWVFLPLVPAPLCDPPRQQQERGSIQPT